MISASFRIGCQIRVQIGAVANFSQFDSHVVPFAPNYPNANSKTRFFSPIWKSVRVFAPHRSGSKTTVQSEWQERKREEEKSLGAYHLYQ